MLSLAAGALWACWRVREMAMPSLLFAVVVGNLVIVCLLVWFGIAPLTAELLQLVPDGDLGLLILKTSLAAGTLAVFAYVLTPRDAEWFAHLGEFLTPILGFVTFLVVAAALGIQRRDLASTRESLVLIQRQLALVETARRYSDSSAVLVKRLMVEKRGVLRGEIECGGVGPALNVTLRLGVLEPEGIAEADAGHPDFSAVSVLFERRFGVIFQAREVVGLFAPVVPEAFEALKNAQCLVLRVRWENIHGTVFRYSTLYRRGVGDDWSAPEHVSFETPEPALGS